VVGKTLARAPVFFLTSSLTIHSSQLSSFEMTSTDASGVATSLGNFKLTTKNTRTGKSQQSVEVGDTKGTFKSIDVGSGMICGMTGRAGNLGKHSVVNYI